MFQLGPLAFHSKHARGFESRRSRSFVVLSDRSIPPNTLPYCARR